MAIINGTTADDLFEIAAINLPRNLDTIVNFDRLNDTIQVDLPSGSDPSELTTTQTGADAAISFRGTQLAIVKNTLVSALSDIIVVIQNSVSTPGSGSIAGISLNGNLLKFDATVKGFGISAVSQKAGTTVNEIGVFAVDDATGKVGGIAPGDAGYFKAVLDSAKSIFATLDGTFFDSTKQEIKLDPNKTYQFFEVKDGSIADVQQQIANGQVPTNLLFSLPDASGNSPISVTNNSTNDGYKVSVNNDELILNVVKLDGVTANSPIGSKSQGSAQGRTLDLTDFGGQTLKASITTTSSSAYNNSIGFYAVEDSIGTIKLANGSTLKPGDADYAVEAIKNAVLQAGKNDSITNQNIAGGKIYAPVLVAQGSLTDFVDKNPTNGGNADAIHAYFNYIGANSDKVDHFRLIGKNTFGVEDLYGGGDRDFNDLVVKATFQV